MNEKVAAHPDKKPLMVAVRYTIDGEVRIFRKDGIDSDEPLEVQEFTPLPSSFKKKHEEAMFAFHLCMDAVRQDKSRMVPVTRDECLSNGITKKELRALEGFGLIRQRIVPILVAKSKKSTGAKPLVYPTAQGRAYWRRNKDV